MLLACLSPRLRARMPALLWLAPLPALAAALLAGDAPPLVLDERVRITLALDPPAAHAARRRGAAVDRRRRSTPRTYLRGDPSRGRFAVWWLLTLTGSLGVFIAADLVSFYLAFALVSLAGLGPRRARRHAARASAPARSTWPSRCSARSAC